MENIKLTGTDRYPEIEFNYSEHRFSIKGYSYPENVKDFYTPYIDPLVGYLTGLDATAAPVNFIFNFKYFHSSTAQVLYRLFDQLEACAQQGLVIAVTWCFENGDDNMEEAGEDFAEEMPHVNFILQEADEE